MDEDFKPHLFIKNVHSSQDYTVPPTGGDNDALPDRDRAAHGAMLHQQLAAIWAQRDQEAARREQDQLPMRAGEYLTFFSAPGATLDIDPLNANGARLLNVKKVAATDSQIATIFVPAAKRSKLLDKIDEYLAEDTPKGKPKNQPFVERTEQISKTTLDLLWNGPLEFIPAEQQVWCEVWLAADEQVAARKLQEFARVTELLDIEVAEGNNIFPERCIATVKVNHAQLEELILSFEEIAEFRRAESLNSFWLNERSIEREEWIDHALQFVSFPEVNNYVTILDSGVNNGHRLLAPALGDPDRLTARPGWGINDAGHRGHGTAMAGLALYGDLKAILERTDQISIGHRLESVKILPPTDEDLVGMERWPLVTRDAVNEATIHDPVRKRIFCMAVTGMNQNDFGKPSTWSAVLDDIIYGDDAEDKKLFIVSAGNVRQTGDFENYFESNLNLSVESPAQAWNAVTVGAYTAKLLPDQATVAQNLELSPYSRTSSSWEAFWPIKPEIIFEGGNRVRRDDATTERHDELELLSTSQLDRMNAFTNFNATSAASALAANFMAKLRNTYPEAWPETLRGLMIHSADWTPELMRQFNMDPARVSEKLRLLRIVGYGVPNLQKALQCRNNYLSFISEQVIQPYKLDGDAKTNEIHYYQFPWPKSILQDIGAQNVKLRITLSYFIEPNPGDKGYTTKYAYQSCALRFALKRPGETTENFHTRTNRVNIEKLKTAQGVEKLSEVVYDKDAGSRRWFYGADTVFRGSIHSNFWEGSGADIADCDQLAVFPVASGWWKLLKKQKKTDTQLRYALIVSIETPENSDDIYTTVRTMIAAQTKIEIQVGV